MGGGDPFSSGDHITRAEDLAGRVLRPGVTALAIPPFMHAAGHWPAFSTFFGGGTVVTTSDGGFDPIEVWRLVEAERANAVVVVGDAMARPLLDALAADPGRFDLSSLMAVGSGRGSAVPVDQGAAGRSAARPDRGRPLRLVRDRTGRRRAAGRRPFEPPRLRIDERTTVLDADLEPVVPGSGVIGRLARGGHVPLGYLGDPDASAATFVEKDGTRWALPGDHATVAADGTITCSVEGRCASTREGRRSFRTRSKRR